MTSLAKIAIPRNPRTNMIINNKTQDNQQTTESASTIRQLQTTNYFDLISHCMACNKVFKSKIPLFIAS